ncbi:uncharacterized protein F4822DRAFT_432636 [Hypoxylon trugodes]|uniref:uncharacterized protein n=1 Tax=Hypoxylon trugodes TaxID=326681 RepID=UPI00218CF165|nr:uncharacterized protein F4822DRAFT_432636 [Hypoxylon trugodes]KAI1385778.1 hypothetical protein F4822DRAFT_432636 [Hypoxylon trugodes]
MATPNQTSFGVEIECIVAYQRGNTKQNRPQMFRDAPGNPIIVPEGVGITRTIRESIEHVINNAVRGHEGDRVLNMTNVQVSLDNDLNNFHLHKYRGWVVKRDYSVNPDDALLKDWDATKHMWEDVEITSPALFATEKSFEEVRRVVQALIDTFWLYAPESSGLHVHIGRGKYYFEIDEIRRLSAFLYAADPILTQMHPEVRRTTQRHYCISNRLYSTLAHGAPSIEASRSINNLTQEGPPITSSRSTGALPREEKRGQNANFFFQRGFLKGYTLDQNEFDTRQPAFAARLPQYEVGKPLPTAIAVEQLLNSPNPPTISLLMEQDSFSPMAYKFTFYGHMYYRKLVMEGPLPSRETQNGRTIEFRQAAGSVDPDEIVAQCKIAVGVCDFARTAPLERLWEVILDLAQGEVNSNWYDVFDLLTELDLVEPAKVIERRLAERAGIDMTDSSQDKR